MLLLGFFLISTLAVLTSADAAGRDDRCLDIHTKPLTTNQLATIFSPLPKPDASAIESIRSTLALYPFSIDGKNYDGLDKVFTPDAVANYSAPIFVVKGLDAIKKAIAPLLAVYTGTHHLYGTQVVNVCEKDTAVAVTYSTATHFVSSNFAGVDQFNQSDLLFAYGRYEDTLVRQRDDTWRIKYRNLVYMVSEAGFIAGACAC
jgi:hypothetical protein